MLQAVRVLAVIALLAGFLWWLRRYDRRAGQPARRRTGRPVEIIGQARLSRQATVAVVRVGERSLTVGVTDHGVNLLAESEYVEPAPEPVEEPSGPDASGAQRVAASLATAITGYVHRITTRVPEEQRPSFAAALQVAAAAPKVKAAPAAERSEGSARRPATKSTTAAGTRRTTAPRARKPEQHMPK